MSMLLYADAYFFVLKYCISCKEECFLAPQLLSGNLSDEGYVKKRSCLSEASSSLFITESLTGQGISADKKTSPL